MEYKLPRYYRKITPDGTLVHLYKEDKINKEDFNGHPKDWCIVEIESLYIRHDLLYKGNFKEEEISEDEAFLELL